MIHDDSWSQTHHGLRRPTGFLFLFQGRADPESREASLGCQGFRTVVAAK